MLSQNAEDIQSFHALKALLMGQVAWLPHRKAYIRHLFNWNWIMHRRGIQGRRTLAAVRGIWHSLCFSGHYHALLKEYFHIFS